MLEEAGLEEEKRDYIKLKINKTFLFLGARFMFLRQDFWSKISTGRKIDKTAFTRQTKIPRPKCTVLTTNIELDCGYWAQIWARWWRV